MMKDVSLLLSRWTGGLGRPMTASQVAMPRSLELRGQRLVYSVDRKLRRIQPDELLDRFIALSDRFNTPADVLSFARRYGPLYLCDHHGIAAYHKPLLMNRAPLGPAPIFGVDELFKYDWCGPRLDSRRPETFSEPIEAWFRLARRASSLLRAANTVRLQGDAPPELWEQVDGFRGSFGKEFGASWKYLDNPSQRLAANLETWLVMAEVCLRVEVQGESLTASLGPAPLTGSSFALIATQLLLAIMRSEGLASCSGCAMPYVSNRPPLAGKLVGPQVAKRNYCRNCREAGIPQRDASRDYRDRKRHRPLLN
ncbi:MAG: hypothetical protein WA993_02935 [Candidatus Binatus sp.]|jgi:hypothetical protein